MEELRARWEAGARQYGWSAALLRAATAGAGSRLALPAEVVASPPASPAVLAAASDDNVSTPTAAAPPTVACPPAGAAVVPWSNCLLPPMGSNTGRSRAAVLLVSPDSHYASPPPLPENQPPAPAAADDADSDVPLSTLRRRVPPPPSAPRAATTGPRAAGGDSSNSDDDVSLAAIKRALPITRAPVSASARASIGKRRLSAGIRRFMDDAAEEAGSSDSDVCRKGGDDGDGGSGEGGSSGSDDGGDGGGDRRLDVHGYDRDDGFIASDGTDDDDTDVSGASEDSERDAGSDCASSDTEVRARPRAGGGHATPRAPTSRAAALSAPLVDGQVHPRSGRIIIAEEEDTEAGRAHRFKSRAAKEALTRALYAEYNAHVFGGALPADMALTWNARLLKTAGLTYSSRRAVGGDVVYTSRIELSVKVLDTPLKLAQTLLHEMCHAAAWLVDHTHRPPHGAVFRKWAHKASRAYPQRTVTVCHSYDIAYKFHYTCQACGYIYGRHSKSIDTTTAACGRSGCGGRLEMRQPLAAGGAGGGAGGDAAGAVGAAATPRKPSAYQTFLATQRKEMVARNPLMTPQQVMCEVARAWTAKKAAATPAPAAAAAAGADADLGRLVDGMRALGRLGMMVDLLPVATSATAPAAAVTAADVIVVDDDGFIDDIEPEY